MSGDRYKIVDQQGIHFVTFTIVGWLDVFVHRVYKDIIVDALNYGVQNKGLKVHSWCLMTSHLHLIISAEDGFELSQIIRDFKKHTAKSIIKQIENGIESKKELLLWYFEREGKKDARITKYKFWKEDNHAIYMDNRDIGMMNQKLDYIHNNPVAEGIVMNPEEYLYSSARDYSEVKGLVQISHL